MGVRVSRFGMVFPFAVQLRIRPLLCVKVGHNVPFYMDSEQIPQCGATPQLSNLIISPLRFANAEDIMKCKSNIWVQLPSTSLGCFTVAPFFSVVQMKPSSAHYEANSLSGAIPERFTKNNS